jgi:flavodoxin
MKTLIIYYSRTGTTKKLAENIKLKLPSEIEEITDTKDRKGPIGYMFSGRDAMRRKLSDLNPINFNPAEFDLVVIGTPVWVANISAPVRTYLEKFKGQFKKVAFFSTMGSSGSDRTFNEMEKIVGVKPVASLSLTTVEVRQEKDGEKIDEFIKKLFS